MAGRRSLQSMARPLCAGGERMEPGDDDRNVKQHKHGRQDTNLRLAKLKWAEAHLNKAAAAFSLQPIREHELLHHPCVRTWTWVTLWTQDIGNTFLSFSKV